MPQLTDSMLVIIGGLALGGGLWHTPRGRTAYLVDVPGAGERLVQLRTIRELVERGLIEEDPAWSASSDRHYRLVAR